MNKRIRIGRKTVGFMCGDFGCLPIYGQVEQLPEKKERKSREEKIHEAIQSIITKDYSKGLVK
jgi:hypothetical protein